MNIRYGSPKEISKAEFLEILGVGVIENICDALVRAVYFISDYNWLVEQFVSLLGHASLEVRGVTITCLGHLVQRNQDANKQQLLDILQPLLLDQQLVGSVSFPKR